MFLGSLINSPDLLTKSHSLPVPLPRPPGNDRDGVHGEWLSGRLPEGACSTLPFTWAGGGSPVWVSGDHVRPANIPGAWTQQPWGRAARFRVLRVSQSNCLSAPSQVNPCAAQGPAALLWPRVGPRVGTQGPTQRGGMAAVMKITRFPVPALLRICWELLGIGLNLSGPPFLLHNGGTVLAAPPTSRGCCECTRDHGDEP